MKKLIISVAFLSATQLMAAGGVDLTVDYSWEKRDQSIIALPGDIINIKYSVKNLESHNLSAIKVNNTIESSNISVDNSTWILNNFDTNTTDSYEYKYVLTSQDIANGSIVNNTILEAVEEGNSITSIIDTNNLEIDLLNGAAAVASNNIQTEYIDADYTWELRVDSQKATAGDIVKYNYTLKNVGTDDLHAIYMLNDFALIPNPINPFGDELFGDTAVWNSDNLNIGHSVSFSYKYTITDNDILEGNLTNTVGLNAGTDLTSATQLVTDEKTIIIDLLKKENATCTPVKRWNGNRLGGVIGDIYTYARESRVNKGARYFELVKLNANENYGYFPKYQNGEETNNSHSWVNLGTEVPKGYCPAEVITAPSCKDVKRWAGNRLGGIIGDIYTYEQDSRVENGARYFELVNLNAKNHYGYLPKYQNGEETNDSHSWENLGKVPPEGFCPAEVK